MEWLPGSRSALLGTVVVSNPLALPLLRRRVRGLSELTVTCIVRASTQQPRLYVGMVLILIFAEVLGLYGVIVSILMLTRSKLGVTECPY